MKRGAAPPPTMPEPRPVSLTDPRLYLNRELSLLEFNRRVLEQARDPGTPLLERLRFLSICSSNLDEFFEIRVASHRERAAHARPQAGPDGRTSADTLEAVSRSAHRLVEQQYRVLNKSSCRSSSGRASASSAAPTGHRRTAGGLACTSGRRSSRSSLPWASTRPTPSRRSSGRA